MLVVSYILVAITSKQRVEITLKNYPKIPPIANYNKVLALLAAVSRMREQRATEW